MCCRYGRTNGLAWAIQSVKLGEIQGFVRCPTLRLDPLQLLDRQASERMLNAVVSDLANCNGTLSPSFHYTACASVWLSAVMPRRHSKTC